MSFPIVPWRAAGGGLLEAAEIWGIGLDPGGLWLNIPCRKPEDRCRL